MHPYTSTDLSMLIFYSASSPTTRIVTATCADSVGLICAKLRQGVLKLVSVVSRILDTMRLVRHYGLKTTRKLRHNWLDTVHLITILLDTINSDSKGPLTSIKHYELYLKFD